MTVVADQVAVTNRAADRCHACGHQAECATWLDSQEQADSPPPDYCRNADLIAAQKAAGPRQRISPDGGLVQ
ncbi:DUF6455 family protein [Mesorhizobium sp.]|uniref:DUF6455 family protein n=1 Tax=Mesorhizobium sp. TaxID=1871066 RepID=UPI0025B802D4|nr:DUF6455 family protein [Mesorhizobium sp.]